MINAFLQKSAQLYKLLTEEVPEGELRTEYVMKINDLLNERGDIIELLRKDNFIFDKNNKMHVTLFELDKGIVEKLNKVMDLIKLDMKELQNSLKMERQYLDPYGEVRNSNARYYDNKK